MISSMLKALPVVDQQELGANGGQPGVDQAQAQARDDLGRGRRQDQLEEHLARREAIHTRHLRMGDAHATHAFERAQHHGVEGREANEDHLGQVACAQQRREQRQPREQRDLAGSVEGRADQLVGQARHANERTHGHAGQRAQHEAREVAPQAERHTEIEVAVGQFMPAGGHHANRGHDELGVDQMQ